MKVIGILLVGIALGFLLGWSFSPGPFRYFYTATRKIELLGSDGSTAGWLPAGTPLVSDEKLVRAPDIGWWAYAPVQFDTMWDARDLEIAPGEKVNLISRMTLHANCDRLDPNGPKSRPHKPSQGQAR